MKNIEIGYLTDINNLTWTVYAKYVTFSPMFCATPTDVVAEDVVLELQDETGNLLETLTRNNLDDLPISFSKKAIGLLELDILDERARENREYLEELKNDY